MAYNHDNGALKDPVVRQAIALAINREELLEAHLGRGDVLSGPFTESSPFYNFEVKVEPQDLDRANQILDQAGYKMAGKVRAKKGKKLDFDFVMDKELASGQQLFLGVQAQLQKIGVTVRPEYVDHARYRDQVFSRKKFDLTMNVWSFEEVEDVYPLFHSKGVMNFINYNNPEVDTLLDTARASHDYKKYKEYMKKLHEVLAKDLPYDFLWSLDVYSGISRKVKNVFIQPYYYFTSFREWELQP
jgi:peptide/nickel transport system substrate-binding protein